MRELTESENKIVEKAWFAHAYGNLASSYDSFEAGFIAALDHSAAQLAAETKMTLCQCGHEESYHDSKDSRCEFPFCSCEYFGPDYPALEDRIAALTAALRQAQDTADALREALKGMLHIFDRGLTGKMIGRKICDEAWAALENQTKTKPTTTGEHEQ